MPFSHKMQRSILCGLSDWIKGIFSCSNFAEVKVPLFTSVFLFV
jgi:hypothetical protein